MNALISKVIAEIGRTLGKAIIAGVGMEIAKVAGTHLQKRLAAKDGGKDKDPARDAPKTAADKEPARDPSGGSPGSEEVRAENERLRAENERLREQLEATRRE